MGRGVFLPRSTWLGVFVETEADQLGVGLEGLFDPLDFCFGFLLGFSDVGCEAVDLGIGSASFSPAGQGDLFQPFRLFAVFGAFLGGFGFGLWFRLGSDPVSGSVAIPAEGQEVSEEGAGPFFAVSEVVDLEAGSVPAIRAGEAISFEGQVSQVGPMGGLQVGEVGNLSVCRHSLL